VLGFALLIVPLLSCSASAQAEADPDESVETGRETLDRWWGYPWYDAATDGVQRINVRPPWNSNWNWPNWSLSWLGPVFRWVAWIAVVAALAAVIYFLVRAYLDRGGIHGSATAADDEAEAAERRRRIESLPFPLQAARYDLLAEARRHYQQGRYGEAVKYLFSYQLVELDKHKIIRLTRGKTNRQYLGEVGRRTPLRRMVEQTMVAFEDFFFGDHAIDRWRFEACWSRLDQFEALVAEGAK
jgi:hypothetical protein